MYMPAMMQNAGSRAALSGGCAALPCGRRCAGAGASRQNGAILRVHNCSHEGTLCHASLETFTAALSVLYIAGTSTLSDPRAHTKLTCLRGVCVGTPQTLSFLSSSAPDVIAQALVASDYAGVLAMLDLLAAGTLDDLTAALLSLLHITMLCERDIAEVLSELGAASHLEAIIATSADTVHDPTGSRTGAAGSCDDRVSDGVGASSKDLPRLAESCLSAMRATNRESSDAGDPAYACAALCIHDDDNHGGETAPEVIKLTRVTDSTTPPSPGHCSSMAAAAPAMTAAAIGALPPTVIAAAVDKAGIEGSPKQSR